ncbi:MAG TPA: hypothetical protein DD490_35575 [Acidobacteria bacterium]|nr:hypothetical protein [Acidobacteriota bacterium]
MNRTMGIWLCALAWLLAPRGAQGAEPPAGTSLEEPSPRESAFDLSPPRAGEQLITFSEHARDTPIDDQYASKGIVFGGDAPFITTDTANPTSPVLSGSPRFFGAIEGSFVKTGEAHQPASVNHFSFDAGFFDAAQSVRVSVYDIQGRLIRRTSNAQTGIRTFQFNDIGISKWRIEAFSQEPAGFAIDNVRLRAPYRAIFAGILGASKIGNINDDPDTVVSVWKDQAIADYVKTSVSFCATTTCLPRNEEHLKKIGASRVGGVVALGFFMTSVAGASSVNSPGNSEVPKNFIVNNYQPGDRVYLTGFSAGGGDAQNVLEKLELLSIPVEVSGHIDSVEIGDDASIPANTRLAKGFHQKQSGAIVRGEDQLKADDSDVTTVTNTKITNPAGPDDPKNDKNNHHRNMDNDPRVWNAIRGAILTSLKSSPAQLSDAGQPSEAGCPRCSEVIDARSPEEQVAVLEQALEARASGEELYGLRELLARVVKDSEAYRGLLREHERAAGDPRLQENLTAVILKVDAGDFLADVEEAASSVSDYPLFAAMVQSLARVDAQEARKGVIRLIANNRLDVPPGKVIDAAVSAFSDGAVAHLEAGWMLDWVRDTALSDSQLYAMARIMVNAAEKPDARALLEELAERIQDRRLKLEVAAITGR